MTTTAVIVQNIPSSTVNIEADVGYSGAVRPASAAHLKVSNDDVSTSNPVPMQLPAGGVTAFYLRSATTGTVASGAYNATFANIGAVDASLLGGALPPGSVVTIRAPEGKTLGDMTYDGTSTILLISGVR